jgi:hypothetical protein
MTTAAVEKVDGVVSEANGEDYLVWIEGEQYVSCRVRAGLRWANLSLQVGDRVAIDILAGGKGRITSKLPEIVHTRERKT